MANEEQSEASDTASAPAAGTVRLRMKDGSYRFFKVPGVADDEAECGGDLTAFILDRTRSEVHLLLDNISANPDVTIASLAARFPRPDDLPEDWIEQVCKVTWPARGENARPESSPMMRPC